MFQANCVFSLVTPAKVPHSAESRAWLQVPNSTSPKRAEGPGRSLRKRPDLSPFAAAGCWCPKAAAQLLDRVDDVVSFAIRHRREQRQGHQAEPFTACDRQMFRRPAELLFVVGMQVQRSPMHRTTDSVLIQRVESTRCGPLTAAPGAIGSGKGATNAGGRADQAAIPVRPSLAELRCTCGHG